MAYRWRLGALDEIGDDGFRRAAFDFGSGAQEHAVAQDGDGEGLHIVRDDIVAPIERGAGAGGTGEDARRRAGWPRRPDRRFRASRGRGGTM